MDKDFVKSEILKYLNLNENLNERKLVMIDRYIKLAFAEDNNVYEKCDYLESHHILPKSIWPEYKNFREHKWNKVVVPLRKHFIMHVILHYIFGGKMTFALYQMISQRSRHYNDYDSHVMITYKARYYELAKKEALKQREGFSTWKDKKGKTYFLHRDDPKIGELRLVPMMTGYKHTQEAIDRMMASCNGGRGASIRVFFMSYRTNVYRDELNAYMDQGWKTYQDSEDMVDIKIRNSNNSRNGAAVVAKKLADGQRIMYDNDGNSHGLMYEDDPRIKKYGLRKDQRTAAMVEQRQEFALSGSIANTGKKAWNNGVIEKNFGPDDIIPDGWVRGGLKRVMVVGHEKKYDWTVQENIDRVIMLLEKHHGSLNDVGREIGISGTNVLHNMKIYMKDVDHRKYWIPKKRYKVDGEYAMGLYDECGGNWSKLSHIVGSNPDSVRFQYEKLWLVA